MNAAWVTKAESSPRSLSFDRPCIAIEPERELLPARGEIDRSQGNVSAGKPSESEGNLAIPRTATGREAASAKDQPIRLYLCV